MLKAGLGMNGANNIKTGRPRSVCEFLGLFGFHFPTQFFMTDGDVNHRRGCWTFHLVLVHVVRLRRIASDFGVVPLPELRNAYFANVDHPSVTLPFMFADRHLPYRGDGNFGIFVSLGRAFVPRPISKS